VPRSIRCSHFGVRKRACALVRRSCADGMRAKEASRYEAAASCRTPSGPCIAKTGPSLLCLLAGNTEVQCAWNSLVSGAASWRHEASASFKDCVDSLLTPSTHPRDFLFLARFNA
jgi:hypothetical protein